MRIYTGRSSQMEGALVNALRCAMAGKQRTHIVVVPKQLTLQTERMLLRRLGLQGSFDLQICSPERLCARIFEAAGSPEGVRVDERGRTMLVRNAVRRVDDRLKLYRGAACRPGFADRCARQLELIRQAGLTPGRLFACAGEAEGILRLKLDDLGLILDAYEKQLEGRFLDGESEFRNAMERVGSAFFLHDADVCFYGFDLTPPTLHQLIAAIGAVCPETNVFLPLENDMQARDYDVFSPLHACFDRLRKAATVAGTNTERILLESDPGAGQRREMLLLSRELFAFPVRADDSGRQPSRVQVALLRNPVEECRFAAALCRRLAMQYGWRWSDMLILCRDIEEYHQPLREAFLDYGVPLFLSSSRAASRHPLAECLISAMRLIDALPRAEDARALLHTGFMPLDTDEVDRLANHITRYGLKPWALLRPLKRGSEAELQAIEPLRERFAAPLNALKRRMKKADSLKGQLSALFDFLMDIDAAAGMQTRLDSLIKADLREQAGEESQVWNRIMGTLDQMAGLMEDAPLSLDELRQALLESLEAAVIKPLPQSADAVFAQTTDRITAQQVKALLILGETDRASAENDGLLSSDQLHAFAHMARAYLGSDDAELSRMRQFYLKSAMEMVTDYLCVTCPGSGMDGGAQRPGALIGLLKGIFPGLTVRGGLAGDEGVQWMLRASSDAAVALSAKALSSMEEGVPVPDCDKAAMACLCRLSGEAGIAASRALERVHMALYHGESAEMLSLSAARVLYGQLRRQSITRLERFAQCPFAYFVQYGLRPDRIEPYLLNVRDEGNFFHAAVHEFMLESMKDLNTLKDEDAGQRMDAIADRLLDAMAAAGPLGDNALALAERRRLKATTRACALVLAEHMRGSCFTPVALETDFGVEDGSHGLIIHADTGNCVLEGKIDRVDEWAEGGYLRVIDYKRGGRDMQLDAIYHGLSLQLPVYLAAAMKKRREQSAGVYYFTLDEGILALQSTDPNLVAQKRRSSFRLSGLAPDDTELLKAQSPNYPEVLNVRVGKDGALYKGTLATDRQGFLALMDRALEMAKRHLDGIRSGNMGVAPTSFRQQKPCQYCDWHSICLFDDRLDDRCVRRFRTIRGDEVLQKLKLEREAAES